VQHQASPAVARPSCQTLGRCGHGRRRNAVTVTLGRPSTRPANQSSFATGASAMVCLGCPSRRRAASAPPVWLGRALRSHLSELPNSVAVHENATRARRLVFVVRLVLAIGFTCIGVVARHLAALPPIPLGWHHLRSSVCLLRAILFLPARLLGYRRQAINSRS
jgi:hypothetical protein